MQKSSYGKTALLQPKWLDTAVWNKWCSYTECTVSYTAKLAAEKNTDNPI